jgi:hypothetical protein
LECQEAIILWTMQSFFVAESERKIRPHCRKEAAMSSLAVRIVALATALAGCSQKSRCVTEGTEVQVAGDHPHSAAVSADQVEKGLTRVYGARGADHEHAFVLKAGDMQRLQRGEPVTTRTSSVNGHVHEVIVRCKE